VYNWIKIFFDLSTIFRLTFFHRKKLTLFWRFFLWGSCLKKSVIFCRIIQRRNLRILFSMWFSLSENWKMIQKLIFYAFRIFTNANQPKEFFYSTSGRAYKTPILIFLNSRFLWRKPWDHKILNLSVTFISLLFKISLIFHCSFVFLICFSVEINLKNLFCKTLSNLLIYLNLQKMMSAENLRNPLFPLHFPNSNSIPSNQHSSNCK